MTAPGRWAKRPLARPDALARGGPPLTGNQEVDQEIMAFYKAREKLVHDRMARGQ